MDIRLYDTMTREKRPFTPADPKRVTMYVCGPTVYNRAHIGNFRPEIVFDVLARLIRHRFGAGALVHARNFTDIDDKIMHRADEGGRTIEDVAAEAEGWYLEDARTLGIDTLPDGPHATAHLDAMIALMERLVGAGHAYAAEGHVLFDTTSDEGYGKLSGRPLADMIAGARVEVAPYKRNPQDFVLWKPSSPEQPGWPSPWGRGRPGWHTECTAMIRTHLGETIDIHGGGQDLIFPHHENEAAQGRCAHGGVPLARVWMHNGFLSMSDQKMSKSVGNTITVPALVDAGHRGETIRLAMLIGHYRQPLDWTEALLRQAKAMLDRWYGLLFREPVEPGEIDAAFLAALADDLNTPAALARLSALAGERKLGSLKASAALLGLLREPAAGWVTGGPDAAVDTKIAARDAARARRDFAEADRIRDELASEGVLLEDGPKGTTWRRE